MSSSDLAELFERPPRPRLRVGMGAAVVLVLVVLGVAIAVSAFRPSPATGALDSPPPTSSGDPFATLGADAAVDEPSAGPVLVHVVGAVASPGVYEVPVGGRVVDAIAAAGGLLADADQAQLNMARALVDGEQLHVPRIGEAPPPSSATGPAPPAAVGAAGELVNLNTATAGELEELPRIGPAMAGRIVDYREQNGGFSSVEQLKEVAGIGDATYEGLVDLVTV